MTLDEANEQFEKIDREQKGTMYWTEIRPFIVYFKQQAEKLEKIEKAYEEEPLNDFHQRIGEILADEKPSVDWEELKRIPESGYSESIALLAQAILAIAKKLEMIDD